MKIFNVLKILHSPTRELLALLDRNIIGTPGLGMLYQHLGVEHKIFKIAKPYFVIVQREQTIMGTGCFCKRTTSNRGYKFTSFYIRYFSFREQFRRKKIVEKHTTKNSLFRTEIHELLGGSGLEVHRDEPFFHYAYVDPRNTRSLVLCNEFGFRKIREYTTVIFSRLFPTAHPVQALHEQEYESMKLLLDDFYANYTMYCDENLFRDNRYYVIKDAAGKIIAGVQANPDHWKVINLPGVSGTFILNTFSKLPLLNRIIHKDYKFLTLEGVYYSPGHEQQLAVLFEGLLHKYQLHSGLLIADAESPVYTALKSLDLGLVDKLHSEVRGHVIVKTNNMSAEMLNTMARSPAYLSGIDVT